MVDRPQDSATQSELVRTSREVLGGRVLEALAAVASDPSGGWWRRSSALLVLSSYVWPALQLSHDNLRAAPGSYNPLGFIDHAPRGIGAVPLPTYANARIRALLLGLAETDSDSSMRASAVFIERTLRPPL